MGKVVYFVALNRTNCHATKQTGANSTVRARAVLKDLNAIDGDYGCREKFTVIVVSTSTGSPLRSVGV